MSAQSISRPAHRPSAGLGGRRTALLASAAAVALVLALSDPSAAQVVVPSAPCNAITTNPDNWKTVTCTGNVAAGIRINTTSANKYSTLKVNTVTGNITPADNVYGINAQINTPTSFKLESNLFKAGGGNYSIIVKAANADGIGADVNTSAGASITIESNAPIDATLGRHGIRAAGNSGDVTITSNGVIEAKKARSMRLCGAQAKRILLSRVTAR